MRDDTAVFKIKISPTLKQISKAIKNNIFPYSDSIRRDTEYLSVFSLNTKKYGREKTWYLDTFDAAFICANWKMFQNFVNVTCSK